MREGDTLVVWKLDRLALSLKQLIETIKHLKKHKIGFLSLTESIDTTTSGGRLIFHIFASLAEFERSIIRERTMVRLAAAKNMGHVGGRPRSSLTAEDILIAKALLKEPYITIQEVAKRLKVSKATFYRYFKGGRDII